MKIGLISDTHGHFDPRIPELFTGVEHILHAGDIGPPQIIYELEKIAPVTAVLGNNDFDPAWCETELIALGGRRFLVHHIVALPAMKQPIHERIARLQPDVVVFGHTHQPFNQLIGRTLFLNPGYAGKRRFNQERSVAVLRCDESGVQVEFKPLA